MNEVACQVAGCREEVPPKTYYKRHKICAYHAGLPTMMLSGQPVRWCQQCGRFQLLGDFDGSRKTCRKVLNQHNERRRKRSSQLRDDVSSDDTSPSATSGTGKRTPASPIFASHWAGDNQKKAGARKGVAGGASRGFKAAGGPVGSSGEWLQLDGMLEGLPAGTAVANAQLAREQPPSVATASESERKGGCAAASWLSSGRNETWRKSRREQAGKGLLTMETQLAMEARAHISMVEVELQQDQMLQDELQWRPHTQEAQAPQALKGPLAGLSRPSPPPSFEPLLAGMREFPLPMPSATTRQEGDGSSAAEEQAGGATSKLAHEPAGGQGTWELHRTVPARQEGPWPWPAVPAAPAASEVPPVHLQDSLVRLSLKLFDVEPEQLDPSVRKEVMALVTADPVFVDSFVRPGCTHLTLTAMLYPTELSQLNSGGVLGLTQLILQHSGWARQQAGPACNTDASTAAAYGAADQEQQQQQEDVPKGQQWAGNMLVQLGGDVAVVQDGRVAAVVSSEASGPRLVTARPVAIPLPGAASHSESGAASPDSQARPLPGGSPWLREGLVTLWGHNISGSHDIIICRQAGRVLNLEIIARGNAPPSSSSSAGPRPEWVLVRPLGLSMGLLQFEVQRGGVLSEAASVVVLPSVEAVAEAQLAYRALAGPRGSWRNFTQMLGLLLEHSGARDPPTFPHPRAVALALRMLHATRSRGWSQLSAIVTSVLDSWGQTTSASALAAAAAEAAMPRTSPQALYCPTGKVYCPTGGTASVDPDPSAGSSAAPAGDSREESQGGGLHQRRQGLRAGHPSSSAERPGGQEAPGDCPECGGQPRAPLSADPKAPSGGSAPTTAALPGSKLASPIAASGGGSLGQGSSGSIPPAELLCCRGSMGQGSSSSISLSGAYLEELSTELGSESSGEVGPLQRPKQQGSAADRGKWLTQMIHHLRGSQADARGATRLGLMVTLGVVTSAVLLLRTAYGEA